MLSANYEKLYWVALPILLIGCFAGMVEFYEYVLEKELWSIHIWVALAFSLVGLFIVCVAGVLEYKEINK